MTHETMHALGRAHEHSRPDAGDHVIVHWANIMDDQHVQYWRRVWQGQTDKPPRCDVFLYHVIKKILKQLT